MFQLNRAEWIGLGLASLILFAAIVPWAGALGMEYDECHFLDPATRIAARHPEVLKLPDGFYVNGRPFPLMTMPYVGALDGWLMAVPIAIFGHSPWVPRMANTAAGIVVLLLAYLLGRRFGGWQAGAITVAMLLVDFEFLLHVPTHYGPFLLQMICGAMICLLLDSWLETGRQSRFYLACAFAGLGFQEKLTFVWIVALLTVFFLALRGREIVKRLSIRLVLIGTVVMLAAMLPVLIYAFGRPEVVFGYGRSAAHTPTWTTLAERFEMFRFLLTGSEFMKHQLGYEGAPERFSALEVLFWAGLAVAIIRRHVPSLLLTGLTVALVAMNALFADGGRLHHLMLAYPMLQAGVGAALSRWRATSAVAALLIAATGVSTVMNLQWYTREIHRTGGLTHWSDAIYRLADWVRARPDYIYVATAWGFYRPLYFLSGGKVSIQDRYFEILPDSITPDNVEDLRRNLERRNALWLTSDFEPMYRANWNKLSRMAAEMGLTPHVVETFDTKLGQPAYRVMAFHPDTTLPFHSVPGGGDAPNMVSILLPNTAGDVSFRLTLNRPHRAGAMAVELLDAEGKPLRAFWRAADWYRFPWPGQRLAFGPGLFPDYFTPLAGAREGKASSLRVTVEGRRGRPPGVSVRDLEVRP